MSLSLTGIIMRSEYNDIAYLKNSISRINRISISHSLGNNPELICSMIT
jgi:hypothetical protein